MSYSIFNLGFVIRCPLNGIKAIDIQQAHVVYRVSESADIEDSAEPSSITFPNIPVCPINVSGSMVIEVDGAKAKIADIDLQGTLKQAELLAVVQTHISGVPDDVCRYRQAGRSSKKM